MLVARPTECWDSPRRVQQENTAAHLGILDGLAQRLELIRAIAEDQLRGPSDGRAPLRSRGEVARARGVGIIVHLRRENQRTGQKPAAIPDPAAPGLPRHCDWLTGW